MTLEECIEAFIQNKNSLTHPTIRTSIIRYKLQLTILFTIKIRTKNRRGNTLRENDKKVSKKKKEERIPKHHIHKI